MEKNELSKSIFSGIAISLLQKLSLFVFAEFSAESKLGFDTGLEFMVISIIFLCNVMGVAFVGNSSGNPIKNLFVYLISWGFVALFLLPLTLNLASLGIGTIFFFLFYIAGYFNKY
jgi:hypothetical protein